MGFLAIYNKYMIQQYCTIADLILSSCILKQIKYQMLVVVNKEI